MKFYPKEPMRYYGRMYVFGVVLAFVAVFMGAMDDPADWRWILVVGIPCLSLLVICVVAILSCYVRELLCQRHRSCVKACSKSVNIATRTLP